MPTFGYSLSARVAGQVRTGLNVSLRGLYDRVYCLMSNRITAGFTFPVALTPKRPTYIAMWPGRAVGVDYSPMAPNPHHFSMLQDPHLRHFNPAGSCTHKHCTYFRPKPPSKLN